MVGSRTPRRHALLVGINEYPHLGEGAQLAGCLNDLELMRELMLDRFEVPKANLDRLMDGEATQQAIRRALESLYQRLEENDELFLFYAGHGSRIRDPGSPDGMLESLVPNDSGRDDRPNRDIVDVELDQWVQRVNSKTPHVTLIFDCCHSGSVTRDTFGGKTREAQPDSREPEKMFAGAPSASGIVDLAARARELERTPGYLRGRRRALVLAACRADELANEYRARKSRARKSGMTRPHGAFTFFLGSALARADPGVTWRDVMDEVSPGLTADFGRQHPQIEGDRDRLVFAAGSARPRSHLQVFEIRGRRVGLTGGAAHGVARGSIWSIYPHTARHAAGEPLARIEVDDVAAATSHGFAADGGEAEGRIALGQRAFLAEHRLPAPGLAVALADGTGEYQGGESLRRRVEDSNVLHPAVAAEADALVYRLAPRDVVSAGDPCPHLGSLSEPTWAAVGSDGRLLVRLRAAGTEEEDALVEDLESVARYRGLLSIEAPPGDDTLGSRVRLTIQRREPGRSEPLVPRPEGSDSMPLFVEAELADFEITNGHDRTVWASLIEFGCDYRISVLLPERTDDMEGGFELEPGASVRASTYYSQRPAYPPEIAAGLPLSLPAGFPWSAEPGERQDTGTVHLKLLVTTRPADFTFLEQGATRFVADHPLQQIAELYRAGQGTRGAKRATRAAGADWSCVTRSISVRRGAP